MPAPRKRNDGRARSWIPLAVVGLGLGSILLLVGGNWLRETLVSTDTHLDRLIWDVRTRTALTHLWIEEYVTGDDVDLDEVRHHGVQSRSLLAEILEEERRIQARGWLKPIGGSLLDPAERAGRTLAQFDAMSREREEGYRRGEAVGIGSPIDIRYDAVFRRLSVDLDAMAATLQARLARAEERWRQVATLLLVAWASVIALAVGGLGVHERHRREAEGALRESEAQLLQSQKMESVGRLAGGMAHDINNHLAAITAQCELVKMRCGDDEATTRKMDAVIETAAKSSTLITRLLAFSRQQPTQPEPVDANDVIRGLGTMLARLIGEDVRMELKLAEGLWRTMIDPSQLEQVLLNLVVNAREAMVGGGDLLLETANDSRGAVEWVRISVSDSGAGIEASIRDKIFEPFFTTKDATGSSGLGLATVHGVVQQHDGEIELESEVGVGTKVHVLFLRTLEEPADSAVQADRQPVAAPLRSRTILLVEDNDDLRASTSEILETVGYRVEVAAGGEAALSAFRRDPGAIDLLVTDVIMPGMNGKQLADALTESRPDLPILFMSGYTGDVILHAGIAESQVEFLAKPFRAQALLARVRSALES